MEIGVKTMVSGPVSDEAVFEIPGEQTGINPGKKVEKPVKSTIFWNAERKRPSTVLIVALVAFTLIFLLYGIVETINSFHEIKIVIESDGEYYGNIRYGDEYEYFSRDTGNREFMFTIREGVTVDIWINRYSSEMDPMTIWIYDNGELVVERIPSLNDNRVKIEYIVGE